MASSPKISPTNTTTTTTTTTGASLTPSQKGVTIFDEPYHIEPVKEGDYNDDEISPTLVAHSPKLHRASIVGKKMTGRPPLSNANSSTSLAQNMSFLSLENSGPESSETETKTPDLRNLLSQVVEWLHDEKAKRHKHRQAIRKHLHAQHHVHRHSGRTADEAAEVSSTPPLPQPDRDSSADNDTDLSLEKLETILASFTSAYLQSRPKIVHKSSTSMVSRKGSIAKKFTRRSSVLPQSSDTEFFGDDVLVPNVEATLDNSKTLAYTGGSADTDANDSSKRRNYDHWITFKRGIVRLTHTLKLKGWRRVPIDRAADIEVARLSGALTNAVYVVHPPKNMSDYEQQGSQTPGTATDSSAQQSSLASKHQPIQLLLRIYGPQAEHLIDRDTELAILRRLARKRIGPRLLGSFENGRFEEFLHATTLTFEDLRVPETSKQIAKRMRELHQGIELLESELDAGPAVFVKWDKWVDRVEKVICFLDEQVRLAAEGGATSTSGALIKSKANPRYARRGLICGVEWPVFRRTFEAYRARLTKDSGGAQAIRSNLIFAHNDTQYGNLMRLQPSGTSPLLQPSNHHKQLVVIDFEYASQNTAGLEFANHFSEWCYNYHHAERSTVCDTRLYPDEKEQYRFVRSYVMHRPQFNPSASATPKMEARDKTNISDFMLDARTPGKMNDYDKEEQEREKAQEAEIQRLLRETRLWRLANSAFWVAWGIVQADVPELEEMEEKEKPGGGIVSGIVEKVKDLASGRTKKTEGPGGDKADSAETGDEKQQQKQHPLSDPLTAEEQRLHEDSKHDRPEGRSQEEAHLEGDSDSLSSTALTPSGQKEKQDEAQAGEGEDEKEEEYDYLAYAQDRARFFWGDCIQMGLVKESELPEELRKTVKIVPF